MLGQYGPERSYHILIHRKRAGRSSLVGRLESIREDGEPGPISRYNVSTESDCTVA